MQGPPHNWDRTASSTDVSIQTPSTPDRIAPGVNGAGEFGVVRAARHGAIVLRLTYLLYAVVLHNHPTVADD
jgi:hypothetical protein